MRRLLLCLLLLLPAFPAAAVAAVAAGASGAASGREPIDITSERLEADNAAHRIHFIGNVVAKQGDVTLYAREMTVFLQPKGEDIEKIEAVGDVRIVQGERVATGQKGIYLSQEGRVVLTGSPQVHRGADVVTGDEITVFLNEQKSIVKSAEGSRVKAVFHPKGKQQAPEKQP